MPHRLDTSARDFEARFAALLADKRETAADVGAAVTAILADVRARGDAALLELTARLDRLELAVPESLRVEPEEIAAARAGAPAEAVAALEFAHGRILAHHRRHRPGDERYRDPLGVELGHRWTAVASAGLYVPGGKAAYPSSVLMNAVPAKVAGVGRLVMCVPAPGGELNPLVLAAAAIAGVEEVYRVGGAQAIAALAFGTPTIAAVDLVVGPGNAYVAAAKRQVFGTVGIDLVAGPSEVLILADADNDPAWIAADLLAQAEHDEAAQSILITDDGEFAAAVERAVAGQLATLPRAEVAGASWRDHGAIIRIADWREAAALADRIAPEHLQIAHRDAEALAAAVRNAGAIFIGRHTPEALGDYVAGTNHVLPTARSARYASGLGVIDFMKRTSIVKCDAEGLAALAPAAIALGRAEGLEAHARSLAIRVNLASDD
jgi:histidinol dehydrogenase